MLNFFFTNLTKIKLRTCQTLITNTNNRFHKASFTFIFFMNKWIFIIHLLFFLILKLFLQTRKQYLQSFINKFRNCFIKKFSHTTPFPSTSTTSPSFSFLACFIFISNDFFLFHFLNIDGFSYFYFFFRILSFKLDGCFFLNFNFRCLFEWI